MVINTFEFDKNIMGVSVKSDTAEFSVINWGATLISVKLPNKKGELEECTLGFNNFKDYEEFRPFFLGSTVGRVGNRISKGKIKIDDIEYDLEKNDNGINHLHGGNNGFNSVLWDISPFEFKDSAGVILKHFSPNGHENYPGNLSITVTYTLTNNNDLIIDYIANTDQKTVVNLTNHTYWNLSGNKKENIFNHEIQIDADHYLPTDKNNIPTGVIAPVDKTNFDLRKLTLLGPAITKNNGYDNFFCFAKGKLPVLKPKNRAYVRDKVSGRSMEILTTEAGVQFYSAKHLEQLKNKGFSAYQGLCLETQGYPDAPNKSNFPSIELKPGETYSQRTIHRFRIE